MRKMLEKRGIPMKSQKEYISQLGDNMWFKIKEKEVED
jgi:hypothetical protein